MSGGWPQLWRTFWKPGVVTKGTTCSPGNCFPIAPVLHQCASQAWLRLSLATSTSILLAKSTSVWPYQCSTGCNCSSQAPLNCISSLFESNYLGSSMLGQKIHWTKPSTPQVGGKCSVRKAKAGCFQRGCSWRQAVTRQ